MVDNISPQQNRQQNIGASDTDSQKTSNGQLFTVEVWFNNHTSDPYKLPQQHIIELVIEEDLFNWPFRGYLIYNNFNEGVERNDNVNAWFYRMDARDEITLKLQIVDDPDNSQYTPEVWEMDLDMIIYNTEDIPASNVRYKHKKIYFWDKKYQLMKEKKLQWSTATAQDIEHPSHVSDSERSMYTGDAIEYLLTNENAANFSDMIDRDNWDKGVSKKLYTSPAQSSISDDLNNVLASHVSSEKDDFCIFKYNNRTDKKQWQLVPMHKLFSKAGKNTAKKDVTGKIIDGSGPGELALETFWLENIEPADENITTPLRAPHTDDISFEIDINIVEWNRITTYDFVDMAGIDNSVTLVSRPVYFYDPKEKQFAVDYADNEIETVKEDFRSKYISELAPNGTSEPIFTLNNTKKNQYAFDPVFTISCCGNFRTRQDRYAVGKLKTLMGAVFTNEYIEFTVNGSPHRTTGKFMAIEREPSNLNNKFDNKICGQWLITNVKHVWSYNRYVNKIGGVKINLYKSNDINEDVE